MEKQAANIEFDDGMTYHNPVMLSESIDYLITDPDGIYVDVTYGGGGHSREILKRLGENGRLIVFDIDNDAFMNRPDDSRLTFVNQNYRYLWNYLKYYDAIPVNGVLADLGVSSHQIDDYERGFAIRKDGELDMRMNNQSGKTAKDILNTYSEEELTHIFKDYGEIEKPYFLIRDILNFREENFFETTADLKAVAMKSAPRNKEFKYLSQVFQAVRIEVNSELDALGEMLRQIAVILKSGGRVAVISYHSLEDRMVKNLFRTGNIEGVEQKDFYGNKITPFEVITRKPVVPSDDEITLNGRARSAKLRVAQKI